MAVTKLKKDSGAKVKRANSAVQFPYYALADSVGVAQTIHARAGGAATLDELAAHLGYGGTNNGAFKSRIAASRMSGLVDKSGAKYVITQTAQGILMPVYEWTSKEALITAFLNVELFRRVYEEYKGKQLPPAFGLKNALKTIFHIHPGVVERAYRVLMESAETAGCFETRAGARTHLIIPTIAKGSAAAQPPAAPNAATAGGSGGGDDDDNNPLDISQVAEDADTTRPVFTKRPTSGMDNMKARYVETLIKLFEAKAEKGDMDEALMGRIEKMLNGQ